MLGQRKVNGESTEVNGGQFALVLVKSALHGINNSQDNRRKSPIRRNKIYGGFKSFNFNNLQAIRRIRRIRRKYGALNSGVIRRN